VLMDWTLTIPNADGGTHTESGTATQVMTRAADGLWRLRISNPAGID
jgi:ketosteroid isomerase-like protein